MNRYRTGIFLSLLLLVGFTSCQEKKTNTKLVLNEVLVDNVSNFQDDYGVHSGWIEIFNQSYSSADLAGCLLRVSSQPGDTATYFIPKGDVLTLVKPRQHTLFWADNAPRRGTFHTNFELSKTEANWIGLYDSGRKLLDQIVVPAGALQADQSYARVSDGAAQWEVKGGHEDRYVTPSTNNQTIESNPKMDKFEQHDPVGIGMAISAMSVVLSMWASWPFVCASGMPCRYTILPTSRKPRKKVSVKLREKSLLPSPWLCMNTREPIMMWKKPF